jgi:hypothetical protein
VKTISEYINIASSEWLKSDMHLESAPVPFDKIFDMAMQLSKQDHDREMESFRIQIRRFEPASAKQTNYIGKLITDETIAKATAWMKERGIDSVPQLSLLQATELIDFLIGLKNIIEKIKKEDKQHEF